MDLAGVPGSSLSHHRSQLCQGLWIDLSRWMPTSTALPLASRSGDTSIAGLFGEDPLTPPPLLVQRYSTGVFLAFVLLTSAVSRFFSSESWLRSQFYLSWQSIFVQPIRAASHRNCIICMDLINTKSFYPFRTETDFLWLLHTQPL